MATFIRFCRDDSGATAIEYGLIAGLISVVIITADAAGEQVQRRIDRDQLTFRGKSVVRAAK